MVLHMNGDSAERAGLPVDFRYRLPDDGRPTRQPSGLTITDAT